MQSSMQVSPRASRAGLRTFPATSMLALPRYEHVCMNSGGPHSAECQRAREKLRCNSSFLLAVGDSDSVKARLVRDKKLKRSFHHTREPHMFTPRGESCPKKLLLQRMGCLNTLLPKKRNAHHTLSQIYLNPLAYPQGWRKVGYNVARAKDCRVRLLMTRVL